MIDLNNFHGYCPGGYRRPEEFEAIGEKCEFEDWRFKARLIDYFLEQYSIDPNAIKRERELWFCSIDKACKMAKEKRPLEEVRKVGEEGETHRDRLQELIYPLYISMLELGFSERDLIG